MVLALSIATSEGVTDIASMAPTINWSGDYARCARTLSFGMVSSPIDASIPVVDVPLGAGILLRDEGELLFEGYIFTRQKLTDSSVVEITGHDRGIYLNKNKAVYKFSNMTPEDITKRVCADFGIQTGNVITTGVRISRNFVGVSLYQIIQTAYTLASRETGDKYQIRFKGSTLEVIKKDISDDTLIIAGGSNLISAAVTESIENMVTQVAIHGDNDKLITTVKNDELIGLYGVMREYLKKTKGEDPVAKARRMLEDNGVSQKITVNNLGDIRCVTGNAVVLQEPYTGLYGLFWIDSDTHTWKKGMYFNKLTLNFRRMMDEREAGSVTKDKKTGKADKWEYVFNQKGGDAHGG